MVNNLEENTLLWISNSLFYIFTFFILFFISKQFFKKRFRKIDIDEELTFKDNLAFSVMTLGYFASVLIVYLGVIQGESHGYLNDAILIIGYGVIGNVLMIITSLLNEKLIFAKKFNIYREIIKDENVGTGVIEAANFIGSALIVYGAISGVSTNLFPSIGEWGLHLSGVISLVLFWIIGQLLLSLSLRVYARISNYDVFNQIEKDNNAVGIVYASVLVALSFLYSKAIEGDIESWQLTFENILYMFGIGVLVLPLSRVIVDKIIISKGDLTYEIVEQEVPNIGVALIEAFAYIGSAILISYCM